MNNVFVRDLINTKENWTATINGKNNNINIYHKKIKIGEIYNLSCCKVTKSNVQGRMIFEDCSLEERSQFFRMINSLTFQRR